jgi:hypothetical protein
VTTTTRTILHDLYEKQRQSPYYDNLCRPISDLVPFIASGIKGVTTNPAVFFFTYSHSVSKQHVFVLLIFLSCCRYLKKLYHYQMLTINSWGKFFASILYSHHHARYFNYFFIKLELGKLLLIKVT